MTQLGFDGFDSQTYGTMVQESGVGQWDGGRFGGWAIGALFGAQQFRQAITPSAELFVGFAHSPQTANPARIIQILADSQATVHLEVTIGSDGTIRLYRGASDTGTLIATSAAGAWVNAAWGHFEMRAKIHDTTGVCQIRVGGTATNVIDFSGDTKNAGTSTNIDGFRLVNVGGAYGSLDDLHWNDALGSKNNSWAGDCRVAPMLPSAAGSQTDFAPSSAVANYTTVDEVPPSSADYNGSATVGARDLYSLADVSSAAGIAAVKTMLWAHKSDTGAKSLKPALKVGSTVYYGATMTLTTSMVLQQDMFENSPATGIAWTPTEINSMEFGAEVA